MLLAENFFEFHARVQNCHFGNFSFLPKWHFWTRAWNSKNFLAKIQDLCRKKYKKGIFSDVQWWKKISTHFSDSTHQECMIFARIGHGSCYSHWNEIFAGVFSPDCPKQPRTSFPFYKFFYPTISGRISEWNCLATFAQMMIRYYLYAALQEG